MTAAHLLNVTDHGPDGFRSMVAKGRMSVERVGRPLEGKGVALLFEKPSNRTRHSMEMAVHQLGGHPVYTRGEEVGLDTRESVEDVTRILAGYHGVIAARVFSHDTVARMSSCSSVPVVNMLSDLSHPLQALADIITMEEVAGDVADLRVAWVGDYNNVARSLAEAVCMLGGSMALGCPPGFDAESAELARLQALGGRIDQSDDPHSAVSGAHFVHTDTWVSMGQESEAAERRAIFSRYQVTESLMAHADARAWFMHCMPAHRGEEVATDVFDSNRSLVIRQGHHRLTGARGALAFLLEETT